MRSPPQRTAEESVSFSHNANNPLDRNPTTMSKVCDTPITKNHIGTNSSTQARFRRRSIHEPNLTDELSTAKERRLNQFGTAVLVWCGKALSATECVELNLGSTHGATSESDVAPTSLQSRTYSIRFGG